MEDIKLKNLFVQSLKIDEMTITRVKPGIKKKIKPIIIKEFGGIDHLPDKISDLLK